MKRDYRVERLDIEMTADGPVALATLVRYPSPQLFRVRVELRGPLVDAVKEAYSRRRTVAIDDDLLPFTALAELLRLEGDEGHPGAAGGS